MTYSLNTLNNTREKPPEMTGWQRFIQEIALAVGFVVLLFLALGHRQPFSIGPRLDNVGF